MTRGGLSRETWCVVILAALIGSGLAVQCALPLAAFTRHISLNNNEGWGAYWSARALSGAPLYTDDASPLSNNYTPLGFYITGYFGRFVGDTIVAGRILCFGSFLACGALIAAIVRRFGGVPGWAIVSGTAFLLIAATVGPRYIAANDPQWMAEAVQLAGLLLLIGPAPSIPTVKRVLAACLVLIVAGLIKHNQVALPIAATLALAVHDRRAFGIWMVTAAVALAATLLVLHLVFGPAFFDQVLHHKRVLTTRYLWPAIVSMSFCLPAGMIIALRWRAGIVPAVDFRRTLLVAFAVLATILGIGERLGAGVSQNAHFDAIIAILLLVGMVLSRSDARSGSTFARLLLMIAVVLPAGVKSMTALPHKARQLAALDQTEAAWTKAIGFLAAQPGLVACERPALCYWAGKPYALDFSNYGQKLRLIGDPWHLRDRIVHQQFGALAIIRDARYVKHDARLPQDFYTLIDAQYRVVQVLPDKITIMAPNR